jgi:hypothetical protein
MKTQRECLLAIFDAYRALVSRPVTMDEVSEWSTARELYPVPNRGELPHCFEVWGMRLKAAIEKGLLPDDQSPRRLRAAEAVASIAHRSHSGL